MNPEVVNIPVPTMLAITKMVAENKPISLFRSWLFSLFFRAFPYCAQVFRVVTLEISSLHDKRSQVQGSTFRVKEMNNALVTIFFLSLRSLFTP